MQKILSAAAIRHLDQYTISHEPIASIDLMERASLAATMKLLEWASNEQPLKILCGCGNNGGDGLAIARLLHERGVQVEVYHIVVSNTCSPDFQTNPMAGNP